MMNVLVTGGTKGLGRAIIDLFYKNGANVAVCARHQSDLDSLKGVLLKQDPDRSVLTFVCDVSKKQEVRALFNYVSNEWGRIDVLVNNAGVFLPGEICAEADGALETMIETNLYSAYHLTRLVAPMMMEKGSGHIFNMCSIASKIAYPNGGSYSISKFALLGFSKVLREELKTKGIKVTSILPGATWSASWEGVDLPKERLMQASDIAIAVWSAYQMSPAAVVEEIVLRPQLGDL